MFETINTNIFDDIGKTLKLIAKVLFYFCVILGAFLTLIGIIRFLSGIDEYTTFSEGLACTLEDAIRYDSLYADCYWGRQLIKIGFIVIISSLGILPLYAFGEIVSILNSIKDDFSIIKNKMGNEYPIVCDQPKSEFKEPKNIAHKWMCDKCGTIIDQSPCPHCGNNY